MVLYQTCFPVLNRKVWRKQDVIHSLSSIFIPLLSPLNATFPGLWAWKVSWVLQYNAVQYSTFFHSEISKERLDVEVVCFLDSSTYPWIFELPSSSYGKPGVEFYGQHKNAEGAVTQIFFLHNQVSHLLPLLLLFSSKYMQDLAFLLLMNIELSGENRRTGVANKCSAGQKFRIYLFWLWWNSTLEVVDLRGVRCPTVCLFPLLPPPFPLASCLAGRRPRAGHAICSTSSRVFFFLTSRSIP